MASLPFVGTRALVGQGVQGHRDAGARGEGHRGRRTAGQSEGLFYGGKVGEPNFNDLEIDIT